MRIVSIRHPKIVVLLVPVLVLFVVGTGLLWLESNRAKMAPVDESVEAKVEIIEGPTSDCWTVFYSPGRWHAIAAQSINDIWAVGSFWPTNDSQPRASTAHWDGNEWSLVPTPDVMANQPDTGLLLNAVATVSTNDVWAVGSYRVAGTGMFDAGYSTLIMHWDGEEWSATPHPTVSGGYMTGVSAASPDDVWAVGTQISGPKLGTRTSIIMHWDGGSWSRIDPGDVDDDGHGPLNKVVAISNDNVWAVGVGIIHWDGQSWRRFPLLEYPDPGSFGELVGLTAIGPDDIWIAGTGSKRGELVTAHWNGKSWIAIPTIDIGNTPSVGFAAFSTNDVWVVSGNSVIHWDGKIWTPMLSAGVAGDVRLEAATVAGDYLWAAGTQIVRHKSACASVASVAPSQEAIP
jgi:hypothetical protein